MMGTVTGGHRTKTMVHQVKSMGHESCTTRETNGSSIDRSFKDVVLKTKLLALDGIILFDLSSIQPR